MAGDKRYYWLKLYDDFFSSLRIKKLRKMAGGDTYVIIYLKLQLKAMKSNGIIKFDGVEQSIAEEIALDIDEEIDNVRITLAYLVSCGLAETNGDSSMFFPYAVANVGSEGSSAQRVREYRERNKLLQCNAGETPVKRISNGEKEIEKEIEIEKETSSYRTEGIGHSDALQNVTVDVTKSNESKSKSKSKRIDKELSASNNNIPLEGIEDDAADDLIKPDPLCVYAANQLRISPTGMDELVSFRDSLPDDLIKYAIDRAIDLGSRNYAYVRKILNGYVEAGFKTVGEAKAAEAKKSSKAKFDDGYDNSGIYW